MHTFYQPLYAHCHSFLESRIVGGGAWKSKVNNFHICFAYSCSILAYIWALLLFILLFVFGLGQFVCMHMRRPHRWFHSCRFSCTWVHTCLFAYIHVFWAGVSACLYICTGVCARLGAVLMLDIYYELFFHIRNKIVWNCNIYFKFSL